MYSFCCSKLLLQKVYIRCILKVYLRYTLSIHSIVYFMYIFNILKVYFILLRDGQTYVALSRATSLQGLYVLRKLEHKHIKANPRVIEEYERLRNTSLLQQNANYQVQEGDPTIPIVLLNIRSLRQHSIDIKFDTKIFNRDMLLLTETQLTPSDSDIDIQDHLHPFILNRQDSDDRYSSLAFCNKTAVRIREKEYFPVINGLMLTAVFTSRRNYEMRFLFLYRKEAFNVHNFIDNLNHIINRYTIDVILGDFNINYFDEKESHDLKNILEGRYIGLSGNCEQTNIFIGKSSGSCLHQIT